MDTTYSGAEVARRLGTSIPRVVRGAERLGLSCRASNGRLRISSKMLRQLEAELGRTPRVPSLTPPQAQVLAALRRAPLGLSSARVVARQAGISPSGASAALKALEARGLVRRESKKIAAGRVRRVELLHANRLAPEWTALTPYLKDVRPKARALRRDKVVPYRLQHLFWNTAPSQLVVSHAGPYIARRLLTSFSYAGLSWGAENLKASDWRTAAKGRGLDPPTRALALNLAGEGDGQS